jgi:DNA-directed RNA polymerase subunit RPC12/RpoP
MKVTQIKAVLGELTRVALTGKCPSCGRTGNEDVRDSSSGRPGRCEWCFQRRLTLERLKRVLW